MTFIEVIKEYMKQKKASKAQLAKKIGVKEAAIDNWLIGNLPYPGTRYNVLKKLNVITPVEDSDGFEYKGAIKKSVQKILDNKEKYYKSKTWKNKEEERLELDGHKCALCGSTEGLQVHHLIYTNDYGGDEPLYSMITVCRKHHLILHRDKPDVKRQLAELEEKKMKLLVIDLADGSHKLHLFTKKCTDKQINAYIKQVEHKYKVKYKNYTIEEIDTDNPIDIEKISFLLSRK